MTPALADRRRYARVPADLDGWFAVLSGESKKERGWAGPCTVEDVSLHGARLKIGRLPEAQRAMLLNGAAGMTLSVEEGDGPSHTAAAAVRWAGRPDGSEVELGVEFTCFL